MTTERLTLTEAATAMRCSRRTVERYVASGKLAAFNVAPPGLRPAVRVSADDVERLRLGQPLTRSA